VNVPGTLFVISAPSGTGKTTVARRVQAELGDLEWSISYTTRPPREGEEDGREYHFVGAGRFERMRGEGAFLESAEVFGHRYGTGLEQTRRLLAEGRDLLLEIDVQGAGQVRQGPVEAVSVMILPPDFATLEGRLAGRGSEGAAQRAGRLAEARAEAEEYEHFDYIVINDDLDRAVTEVTAIVRAERCRVSRRGERARAVLSTFPARS
jgi:guanylate kinase